ncbi:MAG: Mrp/NBP35 family ATP-binding protein [Sulfurovum sp.]|nr:Mrp/NBP35 family ATP-binding protein [Sulfurovum sp.]MCB4750252.1 Mrp/NBP35 family ATP-binding protein [Sulfurovum sp.]MCB4751579.1 Mrp/NBP35 family ATP-binding protein [Sulfurovum sp.]MCB4753615.1 Mrp/NBP35 family ATP-binding protein [Sulfurovum sp.]MCB4761228.1 Mrp/NBP35 family ATP-binding protein [Sulfurovum sp.]
MTQENVLEALKNVTYPGFTKDIVTFGFVKDIVIDEKCISLTIDITSSANEVKEQLINEATIELKKAGFEEIDIAIKAPQPPKQMSNSISGKNIAPHVKSFVMVSSGKGGVGKSTTAVNLAIAMAMQGKKVGLLDADIYGPNIPRMMGLEDQKPEIQGNKVLPLKAYGVEVMSMGSLMEPGQSLIWRGSMIMKAIEQFLRDILWSELDVLVIDMPPGTGDAQLTLAQSVPVTAGITVTTPQEVSLDDSRRSLDMFQKLHIPTAGIIENMSGFICPSCETESDIFGIGTTEPVAKEYDTDVVARIPIEPAIRVGGDTGMPVTYHKPASETAKRYQEAARNLLAFIDKVQTEGGADNTAIQPTTPPGVSACSTGAGATNTHSNGGHSHGNGGCGCH